MKKLLCIAVVTLGITSMAFSQKRSMGNQSSEYQSAIGLRFGTGYFDLVSASFKTFLMESPGALELDLGFKPGSYYYDTYYGNRDEISVSFSGSYQYHFKIPVDGLKWFIGGGLIMSSTSHYGFGLGIFPVGGVDYKFDNIPLNLTADIRPTIGLVNPSRTDNGYKYTPYNTFYPSFGISARYTFR